MPIDKNIGEDRASVYRFGTVYNLSTSLMCKIISSH